MNREEIIAAIKTTTEELGRVPTLDELVEMKRVSQRGIRRRFGAYRAALAACGLERSGAGYTVSREEVFRSWAGVVRRLGKVPSIAEYEMSGGHVVKTVTR